MLWTETSLSMHVYDCLMGTWTSVRASQVVMEFAPGDDGPSTDFGHTCITYMVLSRLTMVWRAAITSHTLDAAERGIVRTILQYRE